MTFDVFSVIFRNQFMQEKFLKLTNAVYNLLEYFPETDPLKIRAKDKALAIMDNLSSAPEDIDALLSYLKLGQKQGWLSHINCLIISNEYEKLKKEIGIPAESIELTQRLPGLDADSVDLSARQNPPSHKVTARQGPPPSRQGGTSARQGKILDFLQKNEKAQVMDLKAVLSDVTKRTIRRDLDELLKIGKIARLGEWNQVFYKMS